jgi:hypothetical protein
MNLADLLPTVRQLSTPQKLTLIQELTSDINLATLQPCNPRSESSRLGSIPIGNRSA